MFNIDKQQVLDAFRHRRATRAYDPSKKISPDDFAYILELARLSPSSIGSEPWQFLVVQNTELRGRLKPVSWGMASQVDDCSHLVVILAKKTPAGIPPSCVQAWKSAVWTKKGCSVLWRFTKNSKSTT